MTPRFAKIRTVSLVWALTACLLASDLLAASQTLAADKKFRRGILTLYYRHKSRLAESADRVPIEHPVNIDTQTMRSHLFALYYEELALLGRKSTVFEKAEIDEIAEWLAKALRQAKPDTAVLFEVRGENGTTIGQTFSTKGKLHWRFSEIRGLKYSNAPNPQWGRGILWKLTPIKGQELYAIEMLIGTRSRENWIVADLAMPVSHRDTPAAKQGAPAAEQAPSGSPEKKAADKPAKPAAEGASGSELEEKLRVLKQLHDKQLIDEEDYKRKRKELMDKNF